MADILLAEGGDQHGSIAWEKPVSDVVWYGVFAGLAVVAIVLFYMSGIVRYVGNNRVAIVEKLWSGGGSIAGGLIALGGEAGFQPDVLRGGFHYFFPFQFRLHTQSLVTIPQGQIGYVFARDGKPLGPTQTLASNIAARDFLDTRGFLDAGGQKGPQRAILREGTYALNLAQFVIITRERIYGLMMEAADATLFTEMANVITSRDGFEAVVIKDADDVIGIVTVHDGPALPAQQIIAPSVGSDQGDSATFHNSFQDPEKFLAAGGCRGRQLQVLVEGSYFINRLFATVEKVRKTIIEIGHVGVVISYTGEAGQDTSGVDYRHGELVAPGSRGVWSEPLLPGKYAFNTYAGAILLVPTTNFILKWDQANIGPHKFDENLSEVSLITKDAFEPILPLSVVVHIDYRMAPMVVQRFGDIKRLVEQTLDPMVSAYFKNVAQKRTLIELLQERSDIQECAGVEMRAKFAAYNLELQEVLIGTPRAAPGNDQIEKILAQLRQRQLADEQVGTYQRQVIAAQKERELREAEAQAKQQTAITESALSIQVQENQGKANLARSQQEANQTRTLAQAEADRIQLLGEGEARKVIALASAEAERVTKVGLAQAEAIEKQAAASGGAQYQLIRQVAERFAEALEKSGVDIVPRIQVSGGGGEGGAGAPGGPLLQALLAMLVADRGEALIEPGSAPPTSDKSVRRSNGAEGARQPAGWREAGTVLQTAAAAAFGYHAVRPPMRTIFRWLAAVLLIPLGVYLGAIVVLGHWPVNRDWQQPASGIMIYVETNGVHSAIIVPANAAGVDWHQRVRAEDLPDPHQAGQWLAFGWGDRDFYINTPTWAQFSLPACGWRDGGAGQHVDPCRSSRSRDH